MLRKIIKTTALILSSVLLLYFICVETATIFGSHMSYVQNYEEFYFLKRHIKRKPFLGINSHSSNPGYKLYFLRGKKKSMLNKIRGELNDTLTDVVNKNSNIIQGYEISDNNKEVYVYFYKKEDDYYPEENDDRSYRYREVQRAFADVENNIYIYCDVS